MTISQQGIDLVKEFEGCRLTAYQDGAGVFTIGYGHTAGVSAGDTCTQEQAESWLIENLADAAATVQDQIDVPLTQGQFDSLCSFVFNLGSGSLHGSTLRKLLNAGSYGSSVVAEDGTVTVTGAAGEFPRWNKVAGKPSAGLTRRRMAEQSLFLSAPAQPAT